MFTVELLALCDLQWPNWPESPPEDCEHPKPKKRSGGKGMSQGWGQGDFQEGKGGDPEAGLKLMKF